MTENLFKLESTLKENYEVLMGAVAMDGAIDYGGGSAKSGQ